MAQAALIRPIWLNACGKLPIISPLPGSTSSASRPTSLMAATARSKVAVAWSSSPASACACASQNALPHAIGAQASQPGRQVVALSGDGGLAMLLGELITLRQLHLPVKVVVFNNGALSFVELEMKASLPPKLSYGQIKGFTLYATRTILSGGGEELIELTKTNLRKLTLE